MKAVFYQQLGSAEVLEVGELPTPEPGPEQVLVRVAAAGVNPIDRRLRSIDCESPSGFRYVSGCSFTAGQPHGLAITS